MSNEYIVKQDNHFLVFDRYVNDLTFKETISVKPCATITKATKFDSVEEAQSYLDRAIRLDKSTCCITTPDEVLNAAKKVADVASDKIVQSMWDNATRTQQEEMMNNLRNNKGEEAVQEWLNKYGPMKEEDTNE